MKHSSLLSAITVACLATGSIQPSMAAQQGDPIPVLARDMKDLGALVQWTRRDGYCTVQIMLDTKPSAPAKQVMSNPGSTPGAPKPRASATQVWLLRADGSAMPALRVSTELPKNIRQRTVTYTYAFPASASQEAAAVAVMIDGRYFVERLEPFPDEK
jgi:hypothetical protein